MTEMEVHQDRIYMSGAISPVQFEVRADSPAQVWYWPEMNQLLIRHVFMEGEFASCVQHEYDAEFTPGWVCQGWEYIGSL